MTAPDQSCNVERIAGDERARSGGGEKPAYRQAGVDATQSTSERSVGNGTLGRGQNGGRAQETLVPQRLGDLRYPTLA